MLGRGLEESRRGEAESLNVRDKIVCNPRIREEGEAILEQKKISSIIRQDSYRVFVSVLRRGLVCKK